MSIDQQLLHLDEMQGASEERTEVYLTYIEEAPQLATQQFAKSDGRVSGFARKQAGAMEKL